MDKVNDYPKISIVTVCFNSVKTIEQAIDSVVNQTYQNIEYIIIDGVSTDGTIEIIKKYEDKIAYWVSEPDNGIYDAMNKGINTATGDYIYFLGSDDCLVNYDVIENVANYFYSNNDIDILSACVLVVDEKLKIQIIGKSKLSIEEIYLGDRIPHQGAFMRATLLKEYLFNKEYKIVADYDLYLKLYFDKNINFAYSEQKIAFYSLEGTSSKQLLKKYKEDIAVMEKYKFPIEYINQYKVMYKKNNFKNLIKIGLKKLGLLKCFLLLHGWEKHSCSLKKCRWCK